MPNYTIGGLDPRLTVDKGSGVWCSTPQTVEYLLYKHTIEAALKLELGKIVTGEDASRHLQHFFNNTGTTLKVDLHTMTLRTKEMAKLYEGELGHAKKYSESLPDGRHHITSTTHTTGYYYDDNPNWHYAMGGFACWGKGVVDVRPKGSCKEMVLNFEFKLFDRYNWDEKKFVEFGPITINDELLQQFHLQCYAREFDIVGSYRNTYWWNASR